MKKCALIIGCLVLFTGSTVRASDDRWAGALAVTFASAWTVIATHQCIKAVFTQQPKFGFYGIGAGCIGYGMLRYIPSSAMQSLFVHSTFTPIQACAVVGALAGYWLAARCHIFRSKSGKL